MLTAEQARKLMPRNRDQLNDILKDIETAAAKNFNWVDSRNLSTDDQIELKRVGYMIKFTPADRDGPGCYRISW